MSRFVFTEGGDGALQCGAVRCRSRVGVEESNPTSPYTPPHTPVFSLSVCAMGERGGEGKIFGWGTFHVERERELKKEGEKSWKETR